MRLAALLAATLLAACGQTGALYLPDEEVKTPVEIRAPAATPQSTPATEPAPTTPVSVPEPEADDKDKKTTPPSGA